MAPNVSVQSGVQSENDFSQYVSCNIRDDMDSNDVLVLLEYIDERWGDLEAIMTPEEELDIQNAYTIIATHIRNNYPQEYDSSFIDCLTGWIGFQEENA